MLLDVAATPPPARTTNADAAWMAVAFDAAERAAAHGECPFGAAVVFGDRLVSVCASTEHSTGSTTAHAEMNALALAARRLDVPLLHGATLYATHEPCLMCTGALLHAQVGRLVVGTLRADLPQVFRQRAIGFRELLADATRPPELRAGVLAERGLALFGALGGRRFELAGCAGGCCG